MEGFVFVPAARHETALSTFDVSQVAESIEFDFVKPVRMVEGLWAARQALRFKRR